MKTTGMTELKPLSSFKKAFDDVTAQKTERIGKLKRMVEDAKKVLADAEATYQSFESKNELFQNLLGEAGNRLTEMTAQDNLAVDASQKVKSLNNTAQVAISTANDTYADTKKMLKSVQQVVQMTLAAAIDISALAETIMSAKSSNPLISSQLVEEASNAANDASKAVSLIVNTLTSSFNALSTANQASNTAEIVQIELNYLIDEMVSQTGIGDDININAIDAVVKEYYQGARDVEKRAQQSADDAEQQMLKAKNDLTRANANLLNTEAALHAAEAAVGS
ncbi:MAG: hypothetical protein ABJO02_00425 [Reichenbachiella sp.]|uniref:hypothetical protein n=1 Tax=Reichenbachiella sp. TaxID=2184521 RepID=UPI0029676F90|nr:hypothetical protein [Reichenbachiella sp.]MDW3211141.1 hypothetical protein [Reichenbachiella sp.]